jgi:hypothetical protein
VVTNSAEAVKAAQAIGGPVVLKVLSPDIAHKTDVGGVHLDVTGDVAVQAAFDAIQASVKAAKPDARIEGVLVSPMRRGGVELVVGVARDPQWGLVMALGLGGVWVEALQDVALRLLPVCREEVVEALRGLKGARLLEGFRGAPAIDFEAAADAAVRIGEAALALGPNLAALEVNPLLAGPKGAEALDALAVWSPGA